MDKETKDIVKLIAGIQIESLNSIKEDVKNGNDIAQDLIKKLLQIYLRIMVSPQILGQDIDFE